jgi:hypothetical protein
MNALILKRGSPAQETRLLLHLRAKTNFSRRINSLHPITPPAAKNLLPRRAISGLSLRRLALS